MEIKKMLTQYNYRSGTADRIKYIVIHYVGALGNAKENCQYYAGGNRGASAHYFVDFDGSVWQSVEDANIAWHCGAKSYRHPECRNANSIGIEMCVRNKGSQADTSRDWYFEDATVKSTIELTKLLMKRYGIDAEHVLRHYDVTGKICPNPYVYNHTSHTWDDFKSAIQIRQYQEGFFTDADGQRWYYLFQDGTYAVNGWYWLTERTGGTSGWYLFDRDGYMLTGYQTAPDGRKYFLNPEPGIDEGKCMCTNDQGELLVVEYDWENTRYKI